MDSIEGKRRHPALLSGLPKAKVGDVPKAAWPWEVKRIIGVAWCEGNRTIALPRQNG
jgi:hypothetical protein